MRLLRSLYVLEFVRKLYTEVTKVQVCNLEQQEEHKNERH